MGGQRAAEGESKHCRGKYEGRKWMDGRRQQQRRESGDRIFDVGRDCACSSAGDSGPDLWGAKARRGRIIFPKRIPRSEVHCSSGADNNAESHHQGKEGGRAEMYDVR